MTEFRTIEAGDIPQALEISYTELGSDYLDEHDFLETIGSEDRFCMVAIEDGEVAGFAICRVFGPESEPEVLGLPDCPERDAVLSSHLTGILDSVSVSPRHKGKGIGTEMCRECVEEMESRGCGIVCAMAWKSFSGRTNIAGILKGMGLKETVSIQGYWNRMVDSPEGHHCPECGAPCRCYGVFWYRGL